MKKSLILTAAAIAVLSACNKEADIAPIDGTRTPVFTATLEPETKTVLVEGSTPGKLTKVNWESSDKVSINGAVYAVTPGTEDASTATLNYESGSGPAVPYKAYYPASMVSGTTASLPASYEYTDGKFNMPMYAQSDETTLAFKNLCGILAITVPSTQMSSVSSIVVSCNQRMNGAFTATAAGVLTFTQAASSDADKKVALTFSAAKAIADGSSETFYIPVPAGDRRVLKITVSDGSVTKVMETRKTGGVTIERNRIYEMTFAHNGDSGLLTGVFSVSESKKVNFTKGNLQATYNSSTSSYTWGFAANQYDFVGNAAGNTTIGSQTDEKVVDLFGYSTSKTNYGINTSATDSDYSGDFKDWGELFDGKNYSTLSKSEWEYLLGTRSGIKYAKAMVNGAKGLLIFPDNYNGTTSGTGIATVNTATVAFPTSSIAADTWTAMESAGVVFLPAAGTRNGSTYGNGGNCFYRFSTSDGDANAYGMKVGNDNVSTADRSGRHYGFSVRLVAVVSESATDSNLLSGSFTINSSNSKVKFTRGNLQATYNGSSYNWGFAAHQYDYVGNVAGNTTIGNQTAGAVVDLFGWSTASTNYGINTSESAGTYSGNFKDWGGAFTGVYSTLSRDEWWYILGSRSGNRYAKAMVNGVNGLLIFPDNYSGTTTGTGIATVNTAAAAFPTSSIPDATWTAMESAGVVFLPAAGYRYGSGVNNQDSKGYYWTKTPYATSTSDNVNYIYINNETVDKNGIGRQYGCSVRLVKRL